MCIQDVALMKYTKSYQESVAVLAASQVDLVAADSNRWSIIIPPPDTGDLLLSINNEDSVTVGIRIFNGANPFVLTRAIHGNLVGKRIRACTPGGNETVTVWVTTLTIPLEKLVSIWRELTGQQ
jgi:hypothetical protein